MTFKTFNTTYTLEDAGDGCFLISGHPRYCPEPTRVTLDEQPVVGRSVRFTYVDAPTHPGAWEGKRITTTPIISMVE